MTYLVSPVITGAEVDPKATCPDCAALLVTLTVGGLHDTGVVNLPSIHCCPDCFDPKLVVAEWREQVRNTGRH